MAMHLGRWPFVIAWLVLVAAFGAGYLAGQLTLGTLAFAELCVMVLGIVALVFARKMNHPSEIVEEVLYRTEHPMRP